MRRFVSSIFMLAFIFSLVACEDIETSEYNDQSETLLEDEIAIDTPVEDNVDTTESVVIEETSIIDEFIVAFNAMSETPITERVVFDPTDKESGHYRTEYRLSAWDGSVGEIAKIGNMDIDIVNYGGYGGYSENEDLRIYITADTIEEILQVFPYAAKAMDPTVTDEEIQEIIDDVKEFGDKNGLYIGELSGLILSHKYYSELMLDLS